ncbi:MAG TPA: hypothetical protein VHA77_11810 [Xanthobacteraceae bacterium]|jgi:hypothetical protein|nr:hypothetical protein [Xanthobacteraceae bacterium]
MFRKTVLATAALASLGAAALVPTAASAHWSGHSHHFWGPRIGFYPAPVYYGGCHWKKQWFETRFGPRYRLVKVCY